MPDRTATGRVRHSGDSAGQTETPDEIAKVAAFLASDESRYITGVELFVDGGQGQIYGTACDVGKTAAVSFKEKSMSNKITLVVRFHMDESVKKEFTAKLQAVFTHIVKEETFVEASLVQDMRDPESVLNYEVWNESPESFMRTR